MFGATSRLATTITATAAACGRVTSTRSPPVSNSAFNEGQAPASSAEQQPQPQQVNEHSFLRNVVPLRVSGAGPACTLVQHAFLQKEPLVTRFLGALEQVPLPALPRMLLAEGMQRLLEGQCPQRELRAIFEEAELECRKLLLGYDANQRAAAAAGYHNGHHSVGLESSTIDPVRKAIQRDPLRRLLAYELRAACGYYARLMAVTSTPETEAAVSVRTLIASDIRTDDFFVDLTLRFASHPRDLDTGARLEPMSPAMAEFVKECLLLERDAFGVFRFDPRGDNRHLMHNVMLSDITKTPTGFSIMLDPIVREYGNYRVDSVPVHGGRWMKHEVSCAKEEHRIDLNLPQLETVITEDPITGGDQTLLVRYDEPLCLERHKETSKEGKGHYGHMEVFELAVTDKNRSWFERYFLDR